MTATMTRFVPFRSPLEGVAVLQKRLNSIFSDFANPDSDFRNESLSAGNFIPPIDIYEDQNRLVLTLEVAIIPRQDLEIGIEGQTLTIKGQRKFPQDVKKENFHRIERRYGTFVRTFTLPSTVDAGSVRADYEDGVLSIELPKKEAAKQQQVKIEIASGNHSTLAPKHMEASQAA